MAKYTKYSASTGITKANNDDINEAVERNQTDPSNFLNRLPLLEKISCKFVEERKWQAFDTFENLAFSINIEVAELLEVFQFRSFSPFLDDSEHQKVCNELSDISLYLARFPRSIGFTMEVVQQCLLQQFIKRDECDSDNKVSVT